MNKHDIDVEPVGTLFHSTSAFLAQLSKVSRQN